MLKGITEIDNMDKKLADAYNIWASKKGKCDHYYEQIKEDENSIEIKCRNCLIDGFISQKWQYLSNGKIQTREGEGE